MKRKNIFEIIENKYDIKEEIGKIDFLFKEALLVVNNPLNFHQGRGNAEAVIEDRLFYDWKQRGSCLSCEEIKGKLGIDRYKQK